MGHLFPRRGEIVFVQGDRLRLSALDSDYHSCAAQWSLFVAVQEAPRKRVAPARRRRCLRRSNSDYMFLSTGHQSSPDVPVYPDCRVNLDPSRRLAEIHLFAIDFW